MEILIGKEYRLEIEKELKDKATPWHKDPKSKLYQYLQWGDLDGLHVKTLGRSKIITAVTYYRVALITIPTEDFLVSRRCLNTPTRKLAKQCLCDSMDLYLYGCKCGYLS